MLDFKFIFVIVSSRLGLCKGKPFGMLVKGLLHG